MSSGYIIPQPIGLFDDASGLWKHWVPYVAQNSDGTWLAVRLGAPYSDGASIPTRVLQALVGPRYGSTSFPPAFFHDMGYVAEIASRKVLDMWFYWHLRQRNSRILSATYWAVVDRLGETAWKRHTPESVAEARKYIRLFATEGEATRWANGDEVCEMEGGGLWLV
jgi:hypothetical protein